MEEKLDQILMDVLGLKREEIRDDLSPDRLDAWDSMNNFKLITMIESEFSIEFTMSEIEKMVDIGCIRMMLSEKNCP